MPVRLELIGERFGRLVVTKYLGNSSWLCNCDCGNSVKVKTQKLTGGNTKSCKCYRNTLLAKERTLGRGYAAFREIVRQYTRSAHKRGHSFELSEDVCFKMMKDDCYYCGSEPFAIKYHRECFGEFVYNGIDRIDSSKGYVLGNVVTCCKKCNYAKSIMSMNEFSEWIDKIYNHKKYWSNKK